MTESVIVNQVDAAIANIENAYDTIPSYASLIAGDVRTLIAAIRSPVNETPKSLHVEPDVPKDAGVSFEMRSIRSVTIGSLTRFQPQLRYDRLCQRAMPSALASRS